MVCGETVAHSVCNIRIVGVPLLLMVAKKAAFSFHIIFSIMRRDYGAMYLSVRLHCQVCNQCCEIFCEKNTWMTIDAQLTCYTHASHTVYAVELLP